MKPTVRAWALVSGGKDSMTLASTLERADMLAGVVAVDTGISAPEWKPFMRDMCAAMGWELVMVSTSVEYDWLVRRYGFPGSALHNEFMGWLKGRGIRAFKKRNPDALLASGVRRGESRRRLGSAKEWGVWEGVPIWAPLVNETTESVWAYMREHKLPRSPVYQTLGISGDCLCGAFAEKTEREALADCYSDLFASRIAPLERETGTRWGCGKAGRGRLTKGEQLICVECDPSGRPESGTRGLAAPEARSADAS